MIELRWPAIDTLEGDLRKSRSIPGNSRKVVYEVCYIDFTNHTLDNHRSGLLSTADSRGIAYGTQLPVLGTNISYVAERVSAATDSEISLKIFEPGALVAPFEVLDAVSTGKVDAGYASAGFTGGRIRETRQSDDYLVHCINGRNVANAILDAARWVRDLLFERRLS